ncbi:glycosyltransferase family 4 protein [Elizabethkingia meningoseptica]
MKIVYNILGTFNSGGMERVLANKVNYLAHLGYDITIVTTDQKNREPYFKMDSRIKHIDLGVNYRNDINQNILEKIFLYFIKQGKHKRKLKKVLTDLKADVVISMFDNDASIIHKIKDGSKKILEIHFSRFKRVQYGRKGIWKIIDKIRSNNDLKIAQQYDRFVVLTEEDKGYWGKLPNIEVIPNANSFVPSGNSTLDYKRAIAIGRYDYQKGFDELIKIWKKVHIKNPDWKLDIFGNGPLKEELQSVIESLNLSEVVKLCPPIKNIEQEYLKSSILLMTSRYEGLPMTLLEAQACGLPMIAYACKCGPKDIIQDDVNGYLIPERESELMVEKISTLIEHDELRKRMGDMSITLSHNFSEDKIMKGWINLFETVVKEK